MITTTQVMKCLASIDLFQYAEICKIQNTIRISLARWLLTEQQSIEAYEKNREKKLGDKKPRECTHAHTCPHTINYYMHMQNRRRYPSLIMGRCWPADWCTKRKINAAESTEHEHTITITSNRRL